MSMVPSNTYQEGDPEGKVGDVVVSGGVAGAFLLLLAAGFAIVALLAFQQMRGPIVFADASSAGSGEIAAPATGDDQAPDGPSVPAQPSPGVSDGGGAVDDAPPTTPIGPTSDPSIKPNRNDAPPADVTTSDDEATVETDKQPDVAGAPPDDPDTDGTSGADTQNTSTVTYSAASPEELFGDNPPADDATAQTEQPTADQPALAETSEPAPVVDDEEPALAQSSPLQQAAPEQTPPEQAAPDPPAAVVDEEPQPQTEPEAAPVVVDPLSGSHVVQLASYRSEAEAMADWARIERRLGSYLDGKTYQIERADLGERGIFFRLRIGPFASPEVARSYCQGLKERGQDCLALRR